MMRNLHDFVPFPNLVTSLVRMSFMHVISAAGQALVHSGLREVVYTHVPLSPNIIICCL